MKKILKHLLLAATLLAAHTYAQEPPTSYTRPADPAVLKNLGEWQDLKFGLLMHWGPYSQWGVVESWSICPEDESWTQRKGPWSSSYFDYVKAYEGLQTTFNPTAFDPAKWAKAAREAGFRYMIFTFKHHDGFCMFDSRLTEYKVTDPKTPFHENSRANIGLEIFNAFRAEGMKVGAYFSKPDWHCKDYWWPYFPPKDRNVNYDPKRYPERWKSYREFTFGQIEEIMSSYGKVDILWLDGGWVRPLSTIDRSVEWQKNITLDQDIDMKGIAEMARKKQPGLIVVDRSVGTEYENYRTPEQEVPEKPLDYPWETCMTMATSWSYVPVDQYKPTGIIIRHLVDIVSKGGNYLLNIGPGPDGTLAPEAYDRMKEIGEWMKVNGEAIYATVPVAPYASGNLRFTKNRIDGHVNVILLADDQNPNPPETLAIPGYTPAPGMKVTLLGSKERITWKTVNGITTLSIPKSVRNHPPCRYAWSFTFYHAH